MTGAASGYASDPDLVVLHGLRCVGFTTVAGVSDATGLAAAEVESLLIDLGVAGLVQHLTGDFGGWGLTDLGRVVDADRIARELDAAGTGPAVAGVYDVFVELNPELLDLCTAWQMRTVGGVVMVNDHVDDHYDGRVLDRLSRFHRRAGAVCADLQSAMLRFGQYRVRLDRAFRRVESGAVEHLADTTVSYHAVWFQLHEDLLVTLGIPRH